MDNCATKALKAFVLRDFQKINYAVVKPNFCNADKISFSNKFLCCFSSYITAKTKAFSKSFEKALVRKINLASSYFCVGQPL
ncbi:MAG: hypothetical protein V7L20_08785, partial [Nostoc sp.]|uniref:hypothetical protein n=1 Tax=Nostoc sp. TaxID=1180 RepID=UPI002FF70BA9